MRRNNCASVRRMGKNYEEVWERRGEGSELRIHPPKRREFIFEQSLIIYLNHSVFIFIEFCHISFLKLLWIHEMCFSFGRNRLWLLSPCTCLNARQARSGQCSHGIRSDTWSQGCFWRHGKIRTTPCFKVTIYLLRDHCHISISRHQNVTVLFN